MPLILSPISIFTEYTMSIFTKLNQARAKFHALKLEKTGHNKFAGYNYFELGDFLIPALTVFNEVGLCAIVSFEKEVATMTIHDVDLKSMGQVAQTITITSPMGSAALKGCHEVQNIGAVETYQRRYLWVAALEIVEHDALDATTGKGTQKGMENVTVHSGPSAAWEMVGPESQHRLQELARQIIAVMPNASQAIDLIDAEELDADHKAALWSRLDSSTRSAIKKATA
jgi:hypothetical protein